MNKFKIVGLFCILIFYSLAQNFRERSANEQNCNNENFESSTPGVITSFTQIQGWTFANHNTLECMYLDDSLQSPISSEIISTPFNSGYIDPNIGSIYPIFSVFGGSIQNNGIINNSKLGKMYGNNFLRIGSSSMSQSVEKVTKYMKVDSLNWMFNYAYMFVTVPGLPGIHTNCCHIPMLKIIVTNLTTHTVINNYNRYVYLYNSSNYPCYIFPRSNDTFYIKNTFTSPLPNNLPVAELPYYTKWSKDIMPFFPYKGDSLRIDFIINKCNNGAHMGYAYLDAECYAGNIYVNGILNTTGSFTGCSSATLSAAPDYTFAWNGPNLSNVQSQSVVVGTSGIYSVTISHFQNVICTQTINVTIINPLPITISSTSDTICKYQSCVLSTLPNLGQYYWSNAATTNSVTVSPTITSSYWVNVIDSHACVSHANKTIVVEECTGIKELMNDQEKLNIYPQPAKDELNLSFEIAQANDFNTIGIYNSLGQLVKEEEITFNNMKASINISNLSAGIYLLKLSRGHFKTLNVQISKRFVIDK
ncbi:MAG: T9SS type A sorting domain-containing protein [Bacteroidia bacterium]